MRIFFKIVFALPGVLFLVMGLRWLVDPIGIAPEFGFALGDGIGRSSQVGDFGAFFLTISFCILLGLVIDRRVWFYPAAMLLLLAALGRLLAWSLHDAAFAADMMAVEVIVGALLLAAARWLPERI